MGQEGRISAKVDVGFGQVQRKYTPSAICLIDSISIIDFLDTFHFFLGSFLIKVCIGSDDAYTMSRRTEYIRFDKYLSTNIGLATHTMMQYKMTHVEHKYNTIPNFSILFFFVRESSRLLTQNQLGPVRKSFILMQ